MAQGATVYAFDIELADSNRQVYQSLALRVARHPSETAEFLWTRVLAYCLEYTEGIAFSNGLAQPDEPAISVRDLTGQLLTWIDVGAPEAARLHRASKAAPRVVVYSHKDTALLGARLAAARIHRAALLELYAVERDWIDQLATRLMRRLQFSLTVAEQYLYLSLAGETISGTVERVAL